MSVTLREVLELDPLRSAGPQVLSGHDRLDQPVRWVHVAELPDIAYLLRGGELVLTTGMGIAGSAEVQRRYVAELAEAKVAGVVIELGRNFQRIPQAMVRSAEQRGLPIIALSREARYVEVTETVHRAIINRQYELLSRAESVSRELTELILSGADLGRIISRLAEIFGNHVVLEDGAHQVVEIGGPRAGIGDVLASWQEHSRSGHEEVDRGTVHHHEEVARAAAGRPARCMWVGLWLRHDPWGRLHVLETESRFHEITELLVDRAGAALGLALLSEKDAAHLADRAGSALIGEVVAGRHGSAADLLRRARSLGADLGRGPLAAVAIEVAELPEVAVRDALSEEERLQIRLSVLNEVRAAAHQRGSAALVGLLGDRVIAVVDVRRADPAGAALEEILRVAATRLSAQHPSLSLVAGASGEVAPGSLNKAADDAVVALSYGRRRGHGRLVTHFPELGTYQLLSRLAQGPELARFVESELRPLLDHDSRARSKLLPTLRAYLDSAGRKADAVRALGVQRRTLYARLEKISRLLDRDLDAQDTRTRLTLALQGLDLLRERGPIT
jgi:PucR family transcriptional regulator, purine catabolism regulatory protein